MSPDERRLLFAASPATATQRIALVVGQNQELEVAAPLRYAVEDARRVANVLEDLGGFDEVRLIESPDAARLLAEVGRLQRQASLLFFYYSGHAGGGRQRCTGRRMTAPSTVRRSAQRVSSARPMKSSCQAGPMSR